jgi:uncharacterized membrane protein
MNDHVLNHEQRANRFFLSWIDGLLKYYVRTVLTYTTQYITHYTQQYLQSSSIALRHSLHPQFSSTITIYISFELTIVSAFQNLLTLNWHYAAASLLVLLHS